MENKNEIIITRDFNAPRELVFKAWTEADRLAKWWGPKEAEMIANISDVRPGGAFHYSMRFPGQPEMWGRPQLQGDRGTGASCLRKFICR